MPARELAAEASLATIESASLPERSGNWRRPTVPKNRCRAWLHNRSQHRTQPHSAVEPEGRRTSAQRTNRFMYGRCAIAGAYRRNTKARWTAYAICSLNRSLTSSMSKLCNELSMQILSRTNALTVEEHPPVRRISPCEEFDTIHPIKIPRTHLCTETHATKPAARRDVWNPGRHELPLFES